MEMRQTTLFGGPVKIAAKPKSLPVKERPSWFNEAFWNALPELERRIHCIAYRELGSSYTVESTQAYLKWIKAGKPEKWSALDGH